MSKKTSFGRKLDPIRVEMAKKVERARHELAMKMVSERVKVDAEFAADVLKVGGLNLREDIKKDALETIAKANRPKIYLENDASNPEAIKIAMETAKTFPSEIIDETKVNKDCALDDPPVWEKS